MGFHLPACGVYAKLCSIQPRWRRMLARSCAAGKPQPFATRAKIAGGSARLRLRLLIDGERHLAKPAPELIVGVEGFIFFQI
jgi:hypothetical protein